jgi:ribosomal protein S18 acetylase RimI-like enzyme
MPLKAIGKKLARAVCGKYQLVRIYRKDITNAPADIPAALKMVTIDGPEAVSKSAAEEIKNHAWYGGRNAFGYGVVEDEKVVCACWYWGKEHKSLPLQFFPHLKDDEVVMVDLITAEGMRGRGYASALISYSEKKLREAGFSGLWTWVWHSNTPSIRTFERSGWKYTGFLIEVHPFQMGRALQIRLRPR